MSATCHGRRIARRFGAPRRLSNMNRPLPRAFPLADVARTACQATTTSVSAAFSSPAVPSHSGCFIQKTRSPSCPYDEHFLSFRYNREVLSHFQRCRGFERNLSVFIQRTKCLSCVLVFVLNHDYFCCPTARRSDWLICVGKNNCQ